MFYLKDESFSQHYPEVKMLFWQKSVKQGETGNYFRVSKIVKMAGVATGLSRLFKAGGLEVKLFLTFLMFCQCFKTTGSTVSFSSS